MTTDARSFSYVSLLQITKLKIDSNPFAKGFRDSSRLTDFERLVQLFSTSSSSHPS